MNRREFHLSALAGTSALFVSGRPALPKPYLVDGDRLNRNLQALAEFGKTPEGGISRVAYSEADRAGRAFAAERMQEAGLQVGIDVAGNLIGTRAGRRSGPVLMAGSHIDSVPGGGNYDGQVGSMAAIEVAHTLQDLDITTEHPIEIIIFSNEEGGKTGSRVLSGEVPPEDLDILTASGFSIGDGTALIGGQPSQFAEGQRQPGTVHAFLELHIEQGAILDRAGLDIGIVEGIVGIKRWNVTVTGFANHAGTTPMSDRQDALLAAGMFIESVNTTTRSLPGRQVATVGRIEVDPGAPNVIPGRVTLSLEIRDLAMEKIDAVYAAVADTVVAIESATHTQFAFEQFYVSRAAPTDTRLRDIIEASVSDLSLTGMRMPSGAGHDAQSIALFAPVGMVFVPSTDGVSHSPREYTEPQAITNGANVLLNVLLAADVTTLD